jgi:DnaJ-class molecular chaperone
MEDYYEILEVSQQATFAEIKTAYRSLCKEYHPDKLPLGTPEKARKHIEERFKQISHAYSVIRNEASLRSPSFRSTGFRSPSKFSNQPIQYYF